MERFGGEAVSGFLLVLGGHGVPIHEQELGAEQPHAVGALVDRLLADPNGALTPLGGNPLWQLALLEMWLQGRGL